MQPGFRIPVQDFASFVQAFSCNLGKAIRSPHNARPRGEGVNTLRTTKRSRADPMLVLGTIGPKSLKLGVVRIPPSVSRQDFRMPTFGRTGVARHDSKFRHTSQMRNDSFPIKTTIRTTFLIRGILRRRSPRHTMGSGERLMKPRKRALIPELRSAISRRQLT